MVSAQHHWQFIHHHQHIEDVRTCVYQDLGRSICSWLAAGNQLIIGIDPNNNTSHSTTFNFFCNLGLWEGIVACHPNPPATQHCNQCCTPIDGIFLSNGLMATSSGYDAFGTGCASDHWPLWLDLSYEDVFCVYPLLLAPVTPRRLQAHDPQSVHQYMGVCCIA